MAQQKKLQSQILTLRQQGKSYKQIATELNCAKSSVCYHLGRGQKSASYARVIRRRACHPFYYKLDNFRRKPKRVKNKKLVSQWKALIRNKIKTFHSIRGYMTANLSFSVDDVINKFGEKPLCYLTGEEIDIYQPRTYNFDHIIPKSRGGSDTLDNLGICTKHANAAKSDMTPDEFINLCEQVVNHHRVTMTNRTPI